MAREHKGSTVEINKAVLPKQVPYRVRMSDLKTREHSDFDHDSGAEHTSRSMRVPIATSDFQVTFWEGAPGESRSWHFHVPSMYQVIYVLQGRILYEYVDDDGDQRRMEAGPGDVLYLPGGFEHRSEVIGDEPNQHLILHPRVPQGRLNAVIGDEDRQGWYHALEDIVGLWYDDVSDRIVKIDEDAVEANPDDPNPAES
ncbi:MAG: cupin domain-containing protein [Halobacteriales archaeon]|nr:cupin domain-containing protein [Halobacteriales archaeon]